jgi:thiol-disulfide isomerase/thioredoxin
MGFIDKHEHKITGYLFLIMTIFVILSCRQNSNQAEAAKTAQVQTSEDKPVLNEYKVTLIELGSTGCLPCKQMQFIMSSVEKKYGKNVKIEFYDVRIEEGKPYASKYGISEIPAQIFLDEHSKEYFRHTGFFPEEGIVKILQMKGVNGN